MTSGIARVHVLVPLFVGGLTYVLLRPTNLLMFSWFEAMGITDAVFTAREYRFVQLAGAALPAWAVYSAPDALWTYSLTFFVADVWRDERRTMSALAWISVGFAAGSGAEIGQFLGMVPGVFDWADLWLCTAASSLAVLVAFRKDRTRAFKASGFRRWRLSLCSVGNRQQQL